MKKLVLGSVLIAIVITLYSQTLCIGRCQMEVKSDEKFLIDRLTKAEKERDIDQTKKLYCEDAIILTPDAPPIVGKRAISHLYKFLWARGNDDFSEYIVDSVSDQKESTEYGRLISYKNNQPNDTFPFYARYEDITGNRLITELNIGNTAYDHEQFRLPKPTGEYAVGQHTYFYEPHQTSINRYLSFQLWFPADQNEGNKVPYRGNQAAEAAANFYGWPVFANSYVTRIETNTYKNASAIQGESFPVLLYNHGYSGFSGVYQTIFEELASHGYIVVSIGHQDESAFLQVDEEIVMPNTPDNSVYSMRAPELNGSAINEFQSVILNSDNSNEIIEAYVGLLESSPLHNESTLLWAKDTKEVIEKLKELNKKETSIKGALDMGMVGVFGHSVGGAVAGELAWSCPDVKAGINLDGFQFGNLIEHSLEIPFLFVSSNPTGDRYLRIDPFASKAQVELYHAVLKGFSHEDFSDLAYTVHKSMRSIEIQRNLILGFFNLHLKGNPGTFTNINIEYNEVEFHKR